MEREKIERMEELRRKFLSKYDGMTTSEMEREIEREIRETKIDSLMSLYQFREELYDTLPKVISPSLREDIEFRINRANQEMGDLMSELGITAIIPDSDNYRRVQ